MREGIDRGETAPAGDLGLIARTGPALVLQGHFLGGAPLAADELARIVDEILIPLLRRAESGGDR